MSHRKTIAILLLTCLAGCASAKRSYTLGSEAEAQGRWMQATEQYIDALQQDPEFPGAREGAYETGSNAIEDYLDVAYALDAQGRYDRALREYARIDRLTDMTASVGVVLELPPDYETRTDATLGRAIDAAFSRADRLAQDGRWREAIDAYRELPRRYRISANQRARVRRARFDQRLYGAQLELDDERFDRAESIANAALDIYGSSAPESQPVHELLDSIHERHYRHLLVETRDMIEQARFQKAFRIVEQAVAIHGPESPASVEALELQDQIITLGTVRVVAMPIGQRHAIEGYVPRVFLDEIDDRLEQNLMSEPVLFIDFANPEEVRQTLERFEYERHDLSPKRVADIAARLEGEFATIFMVQEFEYTLAGEPFIREVGCVHGPPEHVRVFPLRELWVRGQFKLVDVADGRVIFSKRIERSTRHKHRHAIYDGDLDDLLLTREEHRWFDERALHEIDHEIGIELASILADSIADLVIRCVLDGLP